MSRPRIEDLRVFNVAVTWRTEVQVIALDADAARNEAECSADSWNANQDVEIDGEYSVDEIENDTVYFNALPGDFGPSTSKPDGEDWRAWFEERAEAERRLLATMSDGQRARRTDNATLELPLSAPKGRKRGGRKAVQP